MTGEVPDPDCFATMYWYDRLCRVDPRYKDAAREAGIDAMGMKAMYQEIQNHSIFGRPNEIIDYQISWLKSITPYPLTRRPRHGKV